MVPDVVLAKKGDVIGMSSAEYVVVTGGTN